MTVRRRLSGAEKRRRRKSRENEEQSEDEGKTPSIQTHQTDRFIFCVVCHTEDDTRNMVTPCVCRDARYWHYECLVRWIMQCRDRPCQICNHGRYTNSRIRRENRNSRLDYFLDQPGQNLEMFTLIVVMLTGFCLLFYLRFRRMRTIWSDNTLFEMFANVFLEWVLPILTLSPFLGAIGFFATTLNSHYREWSLYREVIYFDDFDGENEQIGATHRYELGEARRQDDIERQLLEQQQQQQNQDQLEDENQEQ